MGLAGRAILPVVRSSATQTQLRSRLLPVLSIHTSTVRMSSSKHSLAKRLEGTDKNVWVEYSSLTTEHKALNLGQGFPDFFPPRHVLESLSQIAVGNNPLLSQYTRSFGHPRLVNALATMFSKIHQRQIDPFKEILVTVGAYQSLFCAVQGLINPGDEVIVIEPFFDCYEPMVKTAGGVPVFIPLRPTRTDEVCSSADWKLDPTELESKFTSKTKAIMFNNPNNPLGKMYSMNEMKMIADLCKKYDVVVISDEVYEWLTYKPNQHIRMATLPDMWDRTLTVSSAGKTFSMTGWKLGWTIGPEYLMRCLQCSHQNCVYTCPTPLQEAVAHGLEIETERMDSPDCYFNSLPHSLHAKRDRLAALLSEVGMVPTIPEGGYFMLADISGIDFKFDESSSDTKDAQFVKWMIREKKLASIPTSAFYTADHKHLAENLIRFCFIKEDSTLQKAEQILREWKKTL